MRVSKRNRIMIKTTAFTLSLLFLMFISVILMGYIYTTVEQNAFGNQAVAFYTADGNYYTVFGNEYYIPIADALGEVSSIIKKYSFSIIKLLGYAKNGTEELIYYIVG